MEKLHEYKRGGYTYADYVTWDDDVRCELYYGEMCVMSPAPTYRHQGISFQLARRIGNFLEGHHSRVFQAPFDVRLDAGGKDDLVLQPDIVLIGDRSILCGTGCAGVPDMVVEILSPSTAQRDMLEKFNIYMRAGVREYWIVDPDEKTVYANVLQDGRYVTTTYADGDAAPVHVLDGCVIDLADVFEE
jgi:Uma2 family endonuclease